MCTSRRSSFLLFLGLVSVVAVMFLFNVQLHSTRTDVASARSEGFAVADSVGAVARHYKRSMRQMHAHAAAGVHYHHMPQRLAMADEQIGLAVSGGHDVSKFRSDIATGKLPRETSFTSAGLFNEYYFDMNSGKSEAANETAFCPSDAVFCPQYEHAVAPDVPTNVMDGQISTAHYLSVGLGSGLSGFIRRPLVTVILVDTSGSMQGQGLHVAKDAVVRIVDTQLNEDDVVGLAIFGCEQKMVVPARPVTEGHKETLRAAVGALRSDCGTPMYDGLQASLAGLIAGVVEYDPKGAKEHRIIAITDSMPNVGQHNEQSFEKFAKQAFESTYRVGLTILGAGLEFNPSIMESLSRTVKSFSYRSMPTPESVPAVVADFRFLVCPLAHDIKLTVASETYQVAAVYGIPEPNSEALVSIPSFFPAPKSKDTGAVKGGVLLLRLVPKMQNASMNSALKSIGETKNAPTVTISVTYQQSNGELVAHRATVKLSVHGASPQAWPQGNSTSNGLRKAILLSRHYDLIHQILSEADSDIIAAEKKTANWEQGNKPLQLASKWTRSVERFLSEFKAESNDLGDAELVKNELAVLNAFLAAPRAK